jgi:murein DD-endopeptidase MepM/ murein hydrolase activator NlpD
MPFAVLAIIGLVVTLGLVGHTSAFADEHNEKWPSWQDVVKARNDEREAKRRIDQIQALIRQIANEVQAAEEEAARAGEAYYIALEALDEAIYNQQQLQAEADRAQETAEESRLKAGQFVAELARTGGGDLQATIFVNASEADGMLKQLGYAQKIAEQIDGIYAKALADQNTATSLTEQAQVASEIREVLQQEAEVAFEAAQAAALRVQRALEAQMANQERLEAQLAVLIEKREVTEADYQKGLLARQLAPVRGMVDAKFISSQGWARPSGGYISSAYGNRIHPIYGSVRFHAGIDLATPCGRGVYAARDGLVSYSGWLGTFGNFIRLSHDDGITTGYAHLQNGSLFVQMGQRVQTGQLIGLIGTTGASTGCHLHYETRVNMEPRDPFDFMSRRGVRLG